MLQEVTGRSIHPTDTPHLFCQDPYFLIPFTKDQQRNVCQMRQRHFAELWKHHNLVFAPSPKKTFPSSKERRAECGFKWKGSLCCLVVSPLHVDKHPTE